MPFKIKIISNPNISLPLLAISENMRIDIDNPVRKYTDTVWSVVAPELFGKNFVVRQIDSAIAEKRSLVIVTNCADAIQCVCDRTGIGKMSNENFEFVVCGKSYTLSEKGGLVGVDGRRWPIGIFMADI
jgi:dTDP-4-amino-4,6-dideoxygalactose transaminase